MEEGGGENDEEESNGEYLMILSESPSVQAFGISYERQGDNGLQSCRHGGRLGRDGSRRCVGKIRI